MPQPPDRNPPADPQADTDLDALGAEPPLELLGSAAQSCAFVVRRHVDKRLDVYLHSRLKRVSRSKVQQLIDMGAVAVNDQPVKRSYVVRKGDRICLHLPAPAVRTIVPQDISLEILHEDDDLIVINKQAGLVVHPARSQLDGTLVNALAFHLKQQVQAAGGVWRDWKTSGLRATDLQGMDDADDAEDTDDAGDEEVAPILPPSDQAGDQTVLGLSSVGLALMRPGIVHRLDKHTTGVMVVAKSEHAHGRIAVQFERRQVGKAYLAVVHGQLDDVGGVVDQPIGKHPTVREAYAVRHDSTARPSVTLYRVRERYRGFCLVELELKTGRTHQIRVHMSYIGHPLVGDLVYGGQAIGYDDLDNPPTPAGARSHLNYARTREEGLPMQMYVLERTMDALARELDMDPLELRRKNFIREFPHTMASGLTIDSGDYHASLDRLLELLDLDAIKADQAARRASGDTKQIGVGFSTYNEMCGLAPSRILGAIRYAVGG
jgi:23S rRNA pseudouridine1911/1915/1917 synthase